MAPHRKPQTIDILNKFIVTKNSDEILEKF
jgi:hypothetical protein